jgi:hypothetical protein
MVGEERQRASRSISVSYSGSPTLDLSGCCYPNGAKDARVEISAGSHGEFVVDPGTGAILRVQTESDLPGFVPTKRSDMMVSYGPMEIGGKTYVVAVRSVNILRSRSIATLLQWNVGFAAWGPYETQMNVFAFEQYHIFRRNARIRRASNGYPIKGRILRAKLQSAYVLEDHGNPSFRCPQMPVPLPRDCFPQVCLSSVKRLLTVSVYVFSYSRQGWRLWLSREWRRTAICNDIYRGAKTRGIDVELVEVQVARRFGAQGSPPRTSCIEHRSKHKEAKEKCSISCVIRTLLRGYTIRRGALRRWYSPNAKSSKPSREHEELRTSFGDRQQGVNKRIGDFSSTDVETA